MNFAKATPYGGILAFVEQQLPEGWELDLLGNRCTIRRGASPRPAGDPKYFGGNIPWIKIGDATRTGGRYVTQTEEFVNEEGAKRSLRIPAGSLLISNSGASLGFSVITKMEGCIHDGWLVATDFNHLDKDYLYYCINHFTRGIRHLADGTTQPNLNTDIAKRLLLPLPQLVEQQRIASFLGTLDDKIDLNRSMNQTSEAMVRSIFKSWFVDFEPVRDGHSLFPNQLYHSHSLGIIPAGWPTGTLVDFVEVILGGDWGSDSADTVNSEAALCIRGADIPSLQNAGIGKMPVRHLKPSSLVKRALREGDLVVEISGGSPTQSTGRPVLISRKLLERLVHPLVCSNFCRMMRLRRGSSAKFVYYWLLWLYSNDEFLQYENGTTGIKNLAFTAFAENYQMVIPPPEVLEEFDTVVSPLIDKQQCNGAESETLAALRDTLLPKLLSGEIRVKQAEKIVREVA